MARWSVRRCPPRSPPLGHVQANMMGHRHNIQGTQPFRRSPAYAYVELPWSWNLRYCKYRARTAHICKDCRWGFLLRAMGGQDEDELEYQQMGLALPPQAGR